MRVDIALEVLGIAAVVVAVSGLADRLRFSAPLLLLLVGVGASYVPFIDEPVLSSEVVLLGFLPPLLYSAAIRTSIIDFRHNIRPIAYLSVALVLITALGVALVTWLLLPVSFPVALALGAVVAPPDAVAATSIARRIGLPRRVVTILEGESLVNDATAITCLRVALSAISVGTFSAFDAGAGFLIALFGGVAVGLAVGALAVLIRMRVRRPVYDTAISFMVPFAAYLPAEFVGYHDLHGSGVIAVVTAGLLLGHKSQIIQTGQSRLNERVNWGTIQFLLENTVFLLIGLQARRTVQAMIDSPFSGLQIAVLCAAVLGTVIALRMAWVFLMRISLFRRHRDGDVVDVPWQATLVVGWAGMRGVVTLATALLIPADTPALQDVRAVLIFAAMVVTFSTLLLQGLTLPPLVRVLHLRGPDARSDALQAATVLTTSTTAALKALDDLSGQQDNPEVVERVRDRIASAPERLWEQLGDHTNSETPAETYRRLRLQTLQVQRDAVLKVRSNGSVDHEVVEEVLDAFDVEESMLTVNSERAEQINQADHDVRTPSDPIGACEHLEAAPSEVEAVGDGRCQDCVREGTTPVHLRLCLECGNVGCCDSSVGRHAERHFRTTGHPVMRSFEPGEDWRWCYLDERLG